MTTSVTTAQEARLGKWGLASGRALRLASAPTFGGMAVVSAAQNADPAICSAASGEPVLSGMTVMYVMMSLFHLHPWLTVIPTRLAVSGTSTIRQERE